MSRILVIDNGGGIGNRMQNLINGFYFRDKYNFTKTYLTWRYQWTWMAHYTDIFSTTKEYELIDESDLGYPPCIWQTGAIYPPGSKKEDFKILIPRSKKFNEEHVRDSHSVILRQSGVYSKISMNESCKIAKDYFPAPSAKLSKKIDSFMNMTGLETDKFLGVHIRKTDKLGQSPRDEYYILEIKKFLDKGGSKVFVCSDDPETEDKITNMFPGSVFSRKKPENSKAVPFVGNFKNSDINRNKVPFSKEIDDKLEQMIPRTGTNPPEWWLEERNVDSGRMMYNCYRNRSTVAEAATDFFILSKSSHILKSVGTFSKMASIISQSRKL